ncbi:putative protein kinase [Leptomonas pyrrhocoris]|uniref:Protein kinase domain-containing protein n=1 Tax=Leptomonas pyrrhocoris TaxID=157538 RepID=A0A0N0DUL0_LEPPY|nr:putative protein kinase [Leptomonas pyrrhocoris]KPA79084.1 putative protein kinase [Leptomonas pyrrhocoris]|eukprot:XP_015657523.1 putative protein kinase [Leptomonas pyrrhocoris]
MDEVSVLQYLGSHPQIVRIMGTYTTSRYINFFSMELMDSDVARELKEANLSFRNESVCVATAYSVLKALEYSHEHGVAHRDVKPGNILLKKLTKAEDWPCMLLPLDSDSTKLLAPSKADSKSASDDAASYVKAALGDFSAAHGVLSTDDAAFADTRGTLHYKSPEQLMGRRGTVSDNFTAVDLWGLGCTMYEMIMGKCPFPGNSELQVLMNILDLMGSDIQSFPSTTKPRRLFQGMSVSAPFLDLLHRLLSLDASARPAAKEALQHPVFESLREAEAHFQGSQNSATGQSVPPIIGISLVLKYASFTHVPQLRFSRISRTPLAAPLLAPELRNSAEALRFRYVASQSSAEGEVAALSALTHYAQKDSVSRHKEVSGTDENAGANEWKKADEESVETRAATRAESVQHRSPDATMMSFMSESEYLHWSEIRPMAQPCALTASQLQRPPPQSADNLDQSTNGRAAGLFGGNTGSTPSPSINYAQQQQRQLSESSRHPSVSMYRNTVARALNISDSSIKVARKERSMSHVDFDLSPVAATQLFSADADADLSTCVVPHAGITAIPRPALPVLQLKCGSTFTASNLRTNSSFERDGNAMPHRGGNFVAAGAVATRGFAGNATGNGNSFSTPRENALRRTTSYVGRALCLSEETDRFARRSIGSCPSQQSCLNSLLASPAPRSRVQEGSSPHPSPIRPHDAAARSPSGLPTVERSGLSSDDSGVGLGWMRLGFDTGAGSSTSADASVCAATAILPSANTEVMAQQDEMILHMAAPMLTAARAETRRSSCGGGTAGLSLTSPLSESSQVRRFLPRPLTSNSATRLVAPPPSSTPADPLTSNACGECSSSDDHAMTARVLPLPIPLSVAAAHHTPSVSRELSCSPSAPPSPLSRTSTSALLPLHETPHTQRFPRRFAAASSKRRGGSATVTVKSASPDHHRQEASEAQVLQSHDVNLPLLLVGDKTHRRRAVTPVCVAPSSLPGAQITLPSYHAAAAARSQRHCTPSSTEPGREASAAPWHDTHPVSAAQLNASDVFAGVSSLHWGGHVAALLHTPPQSAGVENMRAVVVASDEEQRCIGDCFCAATPRSTGRSAYKRPREELVSEEREKPAEECWM